MRLWVLLGWLVLVSLLIGGILFEWKKIKRTEMCLCPCDEMMHLTVEP